MYLYIMHLELNRVITGLGLWSTSTSFNTKNEKYMVLTREACSKIQMALFDQLEIVHIGDPV